MEVDENPEWTKEDFAKAVRFSDLPQAMQRALAKRKRGPQKAPTKKAVTIRLSPVALAALRATGRGWQTKADNVLLAWAKRQPKRVGEKAA